MLFNSFDFLYFLILLLIGYYIPFLGKLQVPLLILSSFFFYSYYDHYLIVLLGVVIIFNSMTSYQILKNKIYQKKKYLMWMSVLFNIGLLFIFKYKYQLFHDFITHESNSNNILRKFVELPLPIGLSFYCFQAVSLSVDLFRNDHKFVKHRSFFNHFFEVSLYLSFFPQLIAGPIVKSKQFLFQIEKKYFKNIQFDKFIKNLIVGYFLKIVIADNLATVLVRFKYSLIHDLASFDLLAMLIGYTVQEFADFAGYSYIAIGLGYLFGYELPMNFNRPFIAKNISEFWQRWHISLTYWIKDYIYIPLGGNRGPLWKKNLNIILSMLFSGLWHGANFGFAVWGLLHGLALVIEKSFKPLSFILDYLKMFLVFATFAFLMGFYKFGEIDQIYTFYHALFFNNINMNDYLLISQIFIYIFPVILYHLYVIFLSEEIRERLERYSFIGYALLVILLLTDYGVQNEFLYFRF